MIRAFISYSHRDEKYHSRLINHLAILTRIEILKIWSDYKIVSGEEWDKEISSKLSEAQVILLLVSADFNASNFCYLREMAEALERHEKNEAKVIPIIIRPCHWTHAPYAKLKALPKDGKPVSKWINRDEAFTNIVEGLIEAIVDVRVKDQAPDNDSIYLNMTAPEIILQNIRSKVFSYNNYVDKDEKKLSTAIFELKSFKRRFPNFYVDDVENELKKTLTARVVDETLSPVSNSAVHTLQLSSFQWTVAIIIAAVVAYWAYLILGHGLG